MIKTRNQITDDIPCQSTSTLTSQETSLQVHFMTVIQAKWLPTIRPSQST